MSGNGSLLWSPPSGVLVFGTGHDFNSSNADDAVRWNRRVTSPSVSTSTPTRSTRNASARRVIELWSDDGMPVAGTWLSRLGIRWRRRRDVLLQGFYRPQLEPVDHTHGAAHLPTWTGRYAAGPVRRDPHRAWHRAALEIQRGSNGSRVWTWSAACRSPDRGPRLPPKGTTSPALRSCSIRGGRKSRILLPARRAPRGWKPDRIRPGFRPRPRDLLPEWRSCSSRPIRAPGVHRSITSSRARSRPPGGGGRLRPGRGDARRWRSGCRAPCRLPMARAPGEQLHPGLYFVRLTAPDRASVRKFAVIR